jgi:ABC-type uncharacterized transport system substrate-binding protein
MTPAHGARPTAPELTLIERAGQPVYQAFGRDLKAALSRRGVTRIEIFKRQSGTRMDPLEIGRLDRSVLIVTVGPGSLAWLLAQHPTTPVLALYVTRETFRRLTRSVHASVTAIYLNQPFGRFLDLAVTLIPRLHAISAVLSQNQKWRRRSIERIAHAHGYTAHVIVTPPEPRAIFSAFRFALPGTDALIELPDATVYNALTLPEIFLRAFRYGVPVIGYAPEYVHDGALAGLYSTPDQFSRQALPIVLAAASHRLSRLPAPAYPRRFTVLLNRSVAGTLGIPLPSLSQILKALHRHVRPKPVEFGI